MPVHSSHVAINARERLTCEHELRRGKLIIRLFRMKPDAAGALHPAGPPLEFAARHLRAVIGLLQKAEAGAALAFADREVA